MPPAILNVRISNRPASTVSITPMPSLTYAQLLRGNRNFRNLLYGQFISELGNWFNFIAGLGLVRLVSEASPTAAGIFFLCRVLPFAVISPIAGTFVDRFSRRQVMIWTDLARVAVALMFLLVTSPENLWIAYIATVLLSSFGAFFDGAKNATTPNLTGRDGILAGTALMFSTRFLLMAIGSGLGGWAAYRFGYQVAFIINAASFLISAFTVWLIPEEATRDEATAERMADKSKRPSFITELKEGLHYTVMNHFALTILLMNIIWAVGGGAINVVFERVGGVHFAHLEGWNSDLGGRHPVAFSRIRLNGWNAYRPQDLGVLGYQGPALDIHRLGLDHSRCTLRRVRVDADAVVVRSLQLHFEGDCRGRVRGAGNAISAVFAGLHPRADIDARPRCRADGLWRDELYVGGTDVFHRPDATDGNLRRAVGTGGRRVVLAAGNNQREDL